MRELIGFWISVTVLAATVAMGGCANPPFCPDDVCDIDGDGRVRSADVGAFQDTMGACSDDAGFSASADFDGNGCVNQLDFAQYLAECQQ